MPDASLRSLMEYADRVPIKLTSLMLLDSIEFAAVTV
jgi:hypothetical protein